MMAKFTKVDYNGYVLVKVGKTAWNIQLDGKTVGYSNSLANAKKALDRR